MQYQGSLGDRHAWLNVDSTAQSGLSEHAQAAYDARGQAVSDQAPWLPDAAGIQHALPSLLSNTVG